MAKSGGNRNAWLAAMIIIIGAALGYVYYYGNAENAVSHSFISWEQAGSEVTTAKLNQPVTLKLEFYSNSLIGFTGKVKLQIRKDITLAADETVVSKTIMLNIPMGMNQKQAMNVTFIPNEKTDTLDRVREYFYRIMTVEGTPIYDPRDSGERNGLKVSEKAGGGTVPTVTGILFNDRPQIEVAAGTSITTKVNMQGTGKGTLKVEIRKDNIGLPDETYTTISKDIALEGSGTVTFSTTWKANPQGVTFREYFARVYWNGDLIYDPTDPAQREYVKISSGGSSGTDSGTDSATGSVSLKSVQWNIVPNQYSTVKTTFKVIGSYDGVVTVDVRKDVSWGGDVNLFSKSHTITAQDSDITVETGFTAPNAGDWIFIRVRPDVYDVTDRDTRKAQNTEAQVPSSTGGGSSTGGSGTGQQPVQNAVVSYNIIELKSGYGSGTRINVPQGTQVNVYATVTSSISTTGNLGIEVRRDLEWKDDTTLTVLSKQVTLTSGTNTLYVGSYIANDLTGSNSFRQYFFKPAWNSIVLNDPTDSNNREAVTTYVTQTPPVNSPQPTSTPQKIEPAPQTPPPVQGSLTISNVGFGYNQQTALVVNKGESVPVYVLATASGGSVYKQITVEIRKDVIGGEDKTYITLYPTVRTSEGTYWVHAGSFTPTESTNWYNLRQYFARVYVDGRLVYDPTNPDTRPHVEVR